MKRILLLAALGALLVVRGASAQAIVPPYSTPPTLQAFQATGLSMPYTAGILTAGGAQIVVPNGTVVLTANMNACGAPQYASCNIVYYPGYGSVLLSTTYAPTAFASGNSVVGFVTTAGTVIQTVVTFFQATSVSDNLLPFGVNPVNAGLRLPLCNLLLTKGCQTSTGSLSGY